jgi:hypothetical protein
MIETQELIRPEFIEAINAFLHEYKMVIGGFLGITTITCMLTLIVNITGLGLSGVSSGGAQKKRAASMKGILVSGICLAVLGSLSVWYGLFIVGILGG